MLRWVTRKISLGQQKMAFRAGKAKDKRGQMFDRVWEYEKGERGYSTVLRIAAFCLHNLERPLWHQLPSKPYNENFARAQVLCIWHVSLINYGKPHWDFTYIILLSLYDKPANGFINLIFQVTWFGLWKLIAFVHGQSCSSVSLLNLVPRISDSRVTPHRMTRTLGSAEWLTVQSFLGPESIRSHLGCWKSKPVIRFCVFILLLIFIIGVHSHSKQSLRIKVYPSKTVCVHVCSGEVLGCAEVHVWRSEDSYVELVLAFHLSVGSWDWTWVIRLT